MKKKYAFLSVILLTFILFLSACGSEGTSGDTEGVDDFRTDLQFGTGSTGGTYYPLGQEMATVMQNNVDAEGFNVSAVASGASLENLANIASGEFQLGMSVHIPALDAYNGNNEFEDSPVTNFGFMGHIYPEVMQVVTTENTGITSISDLAGKKVAIGPPGSGTQGAAKVILAAHGIEDGDYEAFEEGFGDAAGRLQDGQIDASFGLLGLPAGSITELALQRDVVILPIEGEALEFVEENSDYAHLEISSDAYDFLDSPVSTVTAYAILVGSTNQISEDLGYEIVKGLYENVDQITHAQGADLAMENILNGSDGLPLHPGAEKYFKEQGLID